MRSTLLLLCLWVAVFVGQVQPGLGKKSKKIKEGLIGLKCPNTLMCKFVKGGKCVDQATCEKRKGYTWSQNLCAGDDCGCCHKIITAKPTPSPIVKCKQTSVCKRAGGRCVGKETCPEGFDWVPKLCALTGGNECGCCIPATPKPTPSPTKQCQQTDICKEKGGKCTDRETCPSDFEWVPKLCTLDSTQECGCCIRPTEKPTPSPTKQCQQTDICKEKGGKCTDRESCPSSFEWVPSLCSLNSDQECGCCIEITAKPTPSPTKQCQQTDICKEKGGKCTDRESCPADAQWVQTLCSLDSTQECGCCIPTIATTAKPTPSPTRQSIQCTMDDICLQKGGVCTDQADCPEGWNWDSSHCHNDDGTYNEKCGCCVEPTTEPICEDVGCEQANGFCATTDAECPGLATGTHFIDFDLCKGEQCFCCRRK